MPDLWDFAHEKKRILSFLLWKNVLYYQNKGVMTMSVDVLQNKIRKKKNPSALVLSPVSELIPPAYATAFEDPVMAAGEYCAAVLAALKDLVPAVRFDFGAFALLGGGALEQMAALMAKAHSLGYYVLLDWMRVETPAGAESAAKLILNDDSWKCDGVVVCGYGGSECVKPYISAAGAKKDVFVVLKTANKSGAELQDLQTGGRVVYTAAADLVNRWGEAAVERCGYSRIGAMAGANNVAALRNLRQKYPRLFLLVDGMDAPGANAKNAAAAFDRMGHGALCCAGSGILGAWKEAEEGTDPVAAALDAAERQRRNITRYLTVL